MGCCDCRTPLLLSSYVDERMRQVRHPRALHARGPVCQVLHLNDHEGSVNMFTLSSACGAAFDVVDEHTYDMNPHGFVCCSSCLTIIEARKAWMSDPRATLTSSR